MARGVNKVILVGNCGQDPDTKFTASGAAITNISIATSETWKDKQTGQPQERTEWHRVVFFGRLAEIAGEYMRKGSKVYVEGALRTRKWQDQSGQDRYTTEIVANEMQLLDSRTADSGADNSSGYQPSNMNQNRPQAQPAYAQPQATNQYAPQQPAAASHRQPPQAQPAPAQQVPPQPASQPSAAPAMDNFDDDIPF